jgi:hypothetical protein
MQVWCYGVGLVLHCLFRCFLVDDECGKDTTTVLYTTPAVALYVHIASLLLARGCPGCLCTIHL